MHSLIAGSAAARLRPLRRVAARTPLHSDYRPILHATSCMALGQRRPASKMSAIVRGLRRTFRDGESKGMRAPGYHADVAARVAERNELRAQAPEQTFRLYRGKKDVTPEPIPEAKTRRARFLDPESSFGKKSFVYKMKTGAVERELEELKKEVYRGEGGPREPRDGNGVFDRGGRDVWHARGSKNSRGSRAGRDDRRDRGDRIGSRGFSDRNDSRMVHTAEEFWASGDKSERRPRTSEASDRRDHGEFQASSDRSDREKSRASGDRNDRSEFRAPNDRNEFRASSDGHEPRKQYDRQELARRWTSDGEKSNEFSRRGDSPRHRQPDEAKGNDEQGESSRFVNRRTDSADDVPLALPFTTAASQFLYGRSVVEAALRRKRRNLYKLYIYTGANRPAGGSGGSVSGSSEGAERRVHGRQIVPDVMEQLAQSKGVPVQKVGENWQRVLDKMSKGRPHNGFVLEASPLPQMPLTSLGRWVPARNGFLLKPAYQSREEAEINGTADFVPVPAVPCINPKEEKTSAKVVEEAEREEVVLPKVAEEVQHEEEAATPTPETDTAVTAVTAETVKTAEAKPAPPPDNYKPFVLVIDQVLDPGNLGAILRSASFLGIHAAVISKHSSASLTPVALKAAAGAAEAITLFSTDDPADFLKRSRKEGWRVFAAVAPEADPEIEFKIQRLPRMQKCPVLDMSALEDQDPLRRDPCILVVGSEGEGLPRAIRRQADAYVSIQNRSGADVVDSLNVSVATALIAQGFLNQLTQCERVAAGQQTAVRKAEQALW